MHLPTAPRATPLLSPTSASKLRWVGCAAACLPDGPQSLKDSYWEVFGMSAGVALACVMFLMILASELSLLSQSLPHAYACAA